MARDKEAESTALERKNAQRVGKGLTEWLGIGDAWTPAQREQLASVLSAGQNHITAFAERLLRWPGGGAGQSGISIVAAERMPTDGVMHGDVRIIGTWDQTKEVSVAPLAGPSVASLPGLDEYRALLLELRSLLSDTPISEWWRICAYDECLKSFVPRQDDQWFCSPGCSGTLRTAAHAARKRDERDARFAQNQGALDEQRALVLADVDRCGPCQRRRERDGPAALCMIHNAQMEALDGVEE